MITRIICIITLIFCCSCSTNFADTDDFLVQRSSIATSLETNQRYAEALTQWRILQTAYPNDEVVIGHISRLEALISSRVIAQLAILDKAKSAGNEALERKVYLKILALKPDNEIAMQELRKFEWQFAIAEASSKAANIKKYFVESQIKARVSIQLTKYLDQGVQFTQDKKYKRLLLLADKFEKSYPKQPQPNNYRILAYTKLGEAQHKQNSPEAAIKYYQQAIKVAALKGEVLTSVQTKKDTLSKQLATKYLNLANKAFKTDLDVAIEYFELSLKYQPNNTKTRKLMQRAVKVRHNLMKIKKLSESE